MFYVFFFFFLSGILAHTPLISLQLQGKVADMYTSLQSSRYMILLTEHFFFCNFNVLKLAANCPVISGLMFILLQGTVTTGKLTLRW